MRIRRTVAPLALFGMSVVVQAAGAANIYYVSCFGQDWYGGSQSFPWATLSKVAATVQSGDTVMMRSGCTWNETLKLTSGVRYQSYVAAGGATTRPVITGAQSVGQLTWTVDSGNVWVADASSVVKDEADMYGNKVPGGISQLFFNGLRLTRARYPNVGGGAYGVPDSRYLPVGGATDKLEGFSHQIDVSNTPLAGKDLVGADMFLKNNDWFMTRYRVTAFDTFNQKVTVQADTYNASDYVSDRKALHDLDWPGITSYGIADGGYGYWLEGKRWMLDQPGEWSYDPATKKLYVWLRDSTSPQGKKELKAAVRLHAISGYNVKAVDLDGIEARDTRGDAIKVDGFDNKVSSLKINNVAVYNAGRKGINVLNSLRPGATVINGGLGSITNSSVTNSINEGIDLSGDRHWAVSRTQQISVSGNTVTGSGAVYYARGAILLGHRGDALNNAVSITSYNGIVGGKLNSIRGNIVSASCLAFDDCGAIYTNGGYYSIKDEEPGTSWGDLDVGSAISGNFVKGSIQSNDRRDGSGASNGWNGGVRNTTTVGVYLDDYSSSVTVSGNYVSGTDYGIAVHQGSGNTISNNNLVSNRKALLLQQNLSSSSPMQGNLITSNRFATSSGEPIVYLQNSFGATSGLGAFTGNRYATLRSTQFALEDASGSVNRYKTFAQWQASGRDNDVNAALHATSLSFGQASGANPMMNSGNFAGGSSNGWYGIHATVSVTPGSSALTVSPTSETNNDLFGAFRRFSATAPEGFSITAGQRYWLTFTVKADAAGEVVLQFQKGDWPYTDQSVPLALPMSTTARSYSVLLLAGETNASTSLPFKFYIDKNAPLASAKAYVSNVSLSVAAPVSSDAGAVGLSNSTSSVQSFGCPLAVSGVCVPFIDLKTGSSVSFPLSVPVKSSVVLGVNQSSWLDTDRDGIPNGVDGCPATPDGQAVKESGCP